MTKSQLKDIAINHIARLNAENPYSDKMNWVLSLPMATEHGFYFDYKFELINPDESFDFGGAPGFLVSKRTGSIKVLSWAESNELKKE